MREVPEEKETLNSYPEVYVDFIHFRTATDYVSMGQTNHILDENEKAEHIFKQTSK